MDKGHKPWSLLAKGYETIIVLILVLMDKGHKQTEFYYKEGGRV